jgi:hypothetical protein
VALLSRYPQNTKITVKAPAFFHVTLKGLSHQFMFFLKVVWLERAKLRWTAEDLKKAVIGKIQANYVCFPNSSLFTFINIKNRMHTRKFLKPSENPHLIQTYPTTSLLASAFTLQI